MAAGDSAPVPPSGATAEPDKTPEPAAESANNPPPATPVTEITKSTADEAPADAPKPDADPTSAPPPDRAEPAEKATEKAADKVTEKVTDEAAESPA